MGPGQEWVLVQANCRLWLTAHGREQMDTQLPAHRIRQRDANPGANLTLHGQHTVPHDVHYKNLCTQATWALTHDDSALFVLPDAPLLCVFPLLCCLLPMVQVAPRS